MASPAGPVTLTSDSWLFPFTKPSVVQTKEVLVLVDRSMMHSEFATETVKVEASNPEPETVIVVPPAVPPLFGVTPVTDGVADAE